MISTSLFVFLFILFFLFFYIVQHLILLPSLSFAHPLVELSFELGYIEPTDDESSSKCMSAKLSLLRVPRYISLVN